LLQAANILQINNVHEACCDFFHKQLQASNCLGINELAGIHSSMKLLKSSELYILQHFSYEIFLIMILYESCNNYCYILVLREGVDVEEYLNLMFDQVVKYISRDDLKVASEETVRKPKLIIVIF